MAIVPGAPARAADIAAMQQAGTELITFSTLDSFTTTVTFPTAFTATPVMPAPNINTGAGAAGRWDARAINITNTGFTLWVFSNASGATSSWSNIPVQWLAVVDVV